jgi:hypothetical protein
MIGARGKLPSARLFACDLDRRVSVTFDVIADRHKLCELEFAVVSDEELG